MITEGKMKEKYMFLQVCNLAGVGGGEAWREYIYKILTPEQFWDKTIW